MGEETQNFTLECSNEVFGTSLANQFKNLYDKQLFSDIKIELSNGDSIRAHKVVLAVWCPSLLKEISTQNVLRLDKADPTLVKLLVRFLYEGTTPASSEQLLPLIELANIYDIEPVKDACGEALFDKQKDVSFLLDISNKYKVRRLEVLCADHFADNLSTIRKESPEQLYKLHLNTWDALLKKDKLDIKSEQDVFELLMEYIKKRYPTAGPERDQAITKLLPNIRFIALRPEFVINEVEKNPMLAHLPITSQLVFETYKYRALPDEYRKRLSFKTNIRGRSVTHLSWSVDHRHAQITLSEDNMKATSSAQGIYQSIRTGSGILPGSIGYFEITLNAKNNWMVFGVCDSSFNCSNTNWPSSYTNNTWLYHHDYGTFWHNGTASGNRGQIPPIPVNGVVGVLVDHVSSKISFYLNGTLVGTPFTSVPNTELFGFVTCHNLTVVTVNDPPKYTPY